MRGPYKLSGLEPSSSESQDERLIHLATVSCMTDVVMYGDSTGNDATKK